MKTEVYRCRLSGKMKAELAREAQRRGVSVSKILDLAVRDWLKKNTWEAGQHKTQVELHAAAEKYVGVLSGVGPGTAERVRETVRRRVQERILRNQKKTDSSLRSE